MIDDHEQPEPHVTTDEPSAVSDDRPAAPARQTATPRRAPSPRGQAVGHADIDNVLTSAIVFKNAYNRKSLSVHHVQRRLTELGYADANADRDGWYGDLTRMAITAYQRDNGLDVSGDATIETLTHLFSDDPNVAIVDDAPA